MCKQFILLACSVFFFSFTFSQNLLHVRVTGIDGKPMEGVSIATGNKTLGITSGDGTASLSVQGGKVLLQFSSVGFTGVDTLISLPAKDTLRIVLSEKAKQMEDITVIASTRTNQRIENAPLKVEVLGREEMDEESSLVPAGIASILGDVSGVQVQQSSAVSGNANVRIQGLDGRYTQILKDGMPLYDGFSGSFDVLSIPPLDLKQVELIKGAASTLYGGGAIGGLVNIISRTPSPAQSAVLSLNQTILKETNFNSYFSKKYKHFGYTFFGGYNYRKAVDVDRDGFSDVPDLNGWVVHPRLFFYPDVNTTITTGYTGTFEKRNGGDMEVLAGRPSAAHPYFEKNITGRNSFELTAQRRMAGRSTLEFKSSLSMFKRNIHDDEIDFTGRQVNYFTELSFLKHDGSNSFVAGANASGEDFKKLTLNIPLHNFSNNTIGVFVQNTWNIKEKTTIEAGLRDDYQFTYGNFFLPRFAVFHRINPHWAGRAGVGLGYKIPNALAPQTTDYSIQDILPLPADVKPERSIGYNAEVNYKLTWGEENELFINQAFFLTQLNDPVIGSTGNDGKVTFDNMKKPVLTRGFDTYARAVLNGWELYAGYTLTIAERQYLDNDQFMPLTPRNRLAFTVVKEVEAAGLSAGVEGSYTGRQHREDYSLTPGYMFIAMMATKKIGDHVLLVLNCENLLDYRMSKEEPLFTGSVMHPVFKPLWAPIDGRVINLSVKWKL